MEIQKLSDLELGNKLPRLVESERAAIVDFLLHLVELDKRNLYRELGYSSLFDYCTRLLRYSEGAANRRIRACRCLAEKPEIKAGLLSGELSLCTLSLAASEIQKGTLELGVIKGKSKREVEVLVAKERPLPPPRERVKPIAVPVPPLLGESLPPPAVERYEIRFSLSKEDYKALQEVKNRLSNALRSNLTIEGVVSKLVSKYLNKKTIRSRTTNSNSRYIPTATKETVFKRDQGQCTYVAEDGTRCEAKAYLHYDHIKPFAVGGRTEPENLRLLCSCHNKLMAERHFGKVFMSQFG